jgi:hypothetical protein
MGSAFSSGRCLGSSLSARATASGHRHGRRLPPMAFRPRPLGQVLEERRVVLVALQVVALYEVLGIQNTRRHFGRG